MSKYVSCKPKEKNKKLVSIHTDIGFCVLKKMAIERINKTIINKMKSGVKNITMPINNNSSIVTHNKHLKLEIKHFYDNYN